MEIKEISESLCVDESNVIRNDSLISALREIVENDDFFKDCSDTLKFYCFLFEAFKIENQKLRKGLNEGVSRLPRAIFKDSRLIDFNKNTMNACIIKITIRSSDRKNQKAFLIVKENLLKLI